MLPPFQTQSNKCDGDLPPDSVLFGRSDVMQNLRRRLSRVCATSVPVVLQGEMCVGKSVLCRFIHEHSKASSARFLKLNCSSFSDWGEHVSLSVALKSSVAAPAPAGADNAVPAIGTLFLNEVCDLPSERQQELSHLLADYDWTNIRDQQQEAIRILCTSSRDLRREVKQGRFRRDLFDLLTVVTIEVPPLRERLVDLPEIIEHLGRRFGEQPSADDIDFSPDLLAKMLTYSWPGNFCELESFVRRHIALKGDYGTQLHQVPRATGGGIWDWNGVTEPSSTANASKRKM